MFQRLLKNDLGIDNCSGQTSPADEYGLYDQISSIKEDDPEFLMPQISQLTVEDLIGFFA